jgi:hypothetical protein
MIHESDVQEKQEAKAKAVQGASGSPVSDDAKPKPKIDEVGDHGVSCFDTPSDSPFFLQVVFFTSSFQHFPRISSSPTCIFSSTPFPYRNPYPYPNPPLWSRQAIINELLARNGTRSEPLGRDRFHRQYWRFGGDRRRCFVHDPNHYTWGESGGHWAGQGEHLVCEGEK